MSINKQPKSYKNRESSVTCGNLDTQRRFLQGDPEPNPLSISGGSPMISHFRTQENGSYDRLGRTKTTSRV